MLCSAEWGLSRDTAGGTQLLSVVQGFHDPPAPGRRGECERRGCMGRGLARESETERKREEEGVGETERENRSKK